MMMASIDAVARAAAAAAAPPPPAAPGLNASSSSSPPSPAAAEPAAALGGFFLLLLLLAVLVARALHVTRFRYATEGSAALLLGVGATGALSFLLGGGSDGGPPAFLAPLLSSSSSSFFDDSLLFNVLLPPVIFYAGFSAKKRRLFSNAATIAALGAVGTWVAAALIAAGVAPVLRALNLGSGRPLLQTSLALGVVAACSDSVGVLRVVDSAKHPNLHAMVFGEGITNDAVAIGLLSALASLGPGGGSGAGEPSSSSSWLAFAAGLVARCTWLLAASAAFGVAFGLAGAVLVRQVFLLPRLRAAAQRAPAEEEQPQPQPPSSPSSSADQEVLVVALVGLMSYLAASASGLSGVLSVFFSGAVTSHCTWHSLLPSAQSLCLHGFRVVSSFCEMAMFVYAGVDAWATLLAPAAAAAAGGGGGAGGELGAAASGVHGSHRGGREGGSKVAMQAGALAGALVVLILLARALVVLPAAAAANNLWRREGTAVGVDDDEQEQEDDDDQQGWEPHTVGPQEPASPGTAAAAAPLLASGQRSGSRGGGNKRRPGAAAAAGPASLSVGDTLVLYMAGLPRGAVTLALAYHHFDGGRGAGAGAGPAGSAGGSGEWEAAGFFSSLSSRHAAALQERDDHVVTVAVLLVVLLSTVALGALTGPAIAWLLREEEQAEAAGPGAAAQRPHAWLQRSLGSVRARRAAWSSLPRVGAPAGGWAGMGGGGNGGGNGSGGERRHGAFLTLPEEGPAPSSSSGAGAPVDVAQLAALLRAARSGVLGASGSLTVQAAAVARAGSGGGGEAEAAAAATPAAAIATACYEVGSLHAWWKRFDSEWLQPVFGGREDAARRGAVALSFDAFE